MAEEKLNIVVELVDRASKGVNSIKDSFGKLGTTAKVVTAAGIGALTAIIWKSVEAFAQGETQVKGLESALRASGREVTNTTKDFLNFANSMAKVTTVDDDAIVGLLKLGTTMGYTSDQTKQMAQEAIGLSEATGMDLQASFKAVTLAGEGNYMMLQKAIPSLKGITDKTELAAKAQEIISNGFKMAQDRTKTFEGAMIQLGKATEDAQKVIGSVFAPVIQKIATFITDIVNRFNDLSPAMQKNIVIIGTIGAVIIALIPVLGILAASIAAVSWPVLAVVAAVGGLVAGFLIMKSSIDAAGGGMAFLKNSFLSFLQVALEGLQKLLKLWKILIDQLNKIPGINIPIDDAIANIDKLQQKLDEKKEKVKANNAEEVQTEIQKEEELLVVKQTYGQINADLDAAIKDGEKVIEDQEKQRYIDNIRAKSDFELQAMGLTAKQITAIRAQQNAEMQKNFDSTMGYLASGMQSKNKELFMIGKAAAIAQATMSGIQAFNVALASAPPPFNFALAAGVGAMAASKVAEIASTQVAMAEGGVVMPTPGGTSAIIGEAGSPEAVIPLDNPQAQGMLGGGTTVVNIDGRAMAKELYTIQKDMERTGELTA